MLTQVTPEPTSLVSHEVPSVRDLRRELADCIADRDAADGRARFAKDVAARAEEAKCEASLIVERLKNGIDAAQRAATKRYAKAISEALRGGSPLPPTLLPCPRPTRRP